MILVYLLSAVTSFAAAFIKTFQQRNIIQGHELAAWLTSWGITAMEVTSVSMVVVGGWWVILPAGFGGSTGVILAMRSHSKLFKKKI